MKKLYWNDPDPIGNPNRYWVDTLKHVTEDVYFITYMNGQSSAEVFGHELELKEVV